MRSSLRVERDEVFVEYTKSICPVCKVVVDAEVQPHAHAGGEPLPRGSEDGGEHGGAEAQADRHDPGGREAAQSELDPQEAGPPDEGQGEEAGQAATSHGAFSVQPTAPIEVRCTLNPAGLACPRVSVGDPGAADVSCVRVGPVAQSVRAADS